MEARRKLSDNVSDVIQQYHSLTVRYGHAKPPAEEAKLFTESVSTLVNAIRECKDDAEIKSIDPLLISIVKRLLSGEISRYSHLSPYMVVAGAVGCIVGSYTEPAGLSNYESFLHKRNSAIVGAGAGILVGRLFSKSNAAHDAGYKYYREIMHEIESAIQSRHPRVGSYSLK